MSEETDKAPELPAKVDTQNYPVKWKGLRQLYHLLLAIWLLCMIIGGPYAYVAFVSLLIVGGVFGFLMLAAFYLFVVGVVGYYLFISIRASWKCCKGNGGE